MTDWIKFCLWIGTIVSKNGLFSFWVSSVEGPKAKENKNFGSCIGLLLIIDNMATGTIQSIWNLEYEWEIINLAFREIVKISSNVCCIKTQ